MKNRFIHCSRVEAASKCPAPRCKGCARSLYCCYIGVILGLYRGYIELYRGSIGVDFWSSEGSGLCSCCIVPRGTKSPQ